MTPLTDMPPASSRDPAVERAMLCVLGVFALISLRSPGTSDMMAFWMPFYKQMNGLGLVEGYRSTALDYPPFTHALIHWSGGAMAAYLIDPLWGFKACVLLFTVLAAAVFRWAWRGGLPFYLLVAGAVVSGSMLGYLDVFYAPTVLLALWALERRRLALFSGLFAVACFTKWQPLIFAPFCAWHALRPAGAGPRDGLAWNVSRAARLAVPTLAIVLAVLLAYGLPVVNAFRVAMDDTFLSGDALNANWAATYLLNVWHPGLIPALVHGEAQTIDAPALGGWMWVPKLVFIGMYGLCLWRFHRGTNTFREFLRASMLGFLTYCMFNTGVHENHFYLVSLLACVLAAVDARATPQAFLVSFFAVMNLVVFYGFSGGGLGFSRVVGLDTTFVLALIYTALYLWWWLNWMREVDLLPRGRPADFSAPSPESLPPCAARLNSPSMDAIRKTPLVTTEHALLFAAAASGLVFLRCQGNGDLINFWLTFLRNVEQQGLAGGFRLNAADQPPLSLALLLGVRSVCNRWGAIDFTSIKVCLLLFYGLSIAVFRTCWRGLIPLALLVGTVLLTSVMRCYLDVLCVPTLLLSLWALRQRRIVLFSVLYALTCLIDWQPMILAPFFVWQAVRPPAPGEGTEESPAGRPLVRLLCPGGLVFLAAGLVFGWPLLQAWRANLADPYLSNLALNANWAWTFLLHCRYPARFGPLINGYPVSNAYPIAFSPVVNGYSKPVLAAALHGWVWLPRVILTGVYALTLWRFFRGGRSFAEGLRAALFGCLADCLFDVGGRENQFFAPAVLACVLASVDPRETARAIIVTGMAALNLVIFDGFFGSGLGYPRVLGVDLTFPLSVLYVVIYLWWWVSWLRAGTHPRRPVEADAPLAPGDPRANLPDTAQRV